MSNNQPTWDVVIAGAGPSGTTAATILAQAGHDVLVIDKDEFPRFHIGESLLPLGWNVLESIGISPNEDTYLFKRGAEFVCERTDQSACFKFSEALPGPPRHAWQVERSTFDRQLRDRAVEAGATVKHGYQATAFEASASGVTLETNRGEITARFFIDATGQNRFVARKKRSVRPLKEFGKAAVYSHFTDISDEAWSDFAPHHDIRIMMVDKGWGWVIPLPGRRLSIGLVSKRRGISPDWLGQYIESSPLLTRWTEGADATEPSIASNFSYENTASYGSRYVCIGDAACFLDPVFSSGVSLGLEGAYRVSHLLHEALTRGAEADPALLDNYAATMKRAYDTFAAMIYRFYNTKFVDNMIFGAPRDGELRAGVTSVLAGDAFRADNPFQDMLLRSRRRPSFSAKTKVRART
jgi:flavin-dependent dehydrogenase